MQCKLMLSTIQILSMQRLLAERVKKGCVQALDPKLAFAGNAAWAVTLGDLIRTTTAAFLSMPVVFGLDSNSMSWSSCIDSFAADGGEAFENG